MGTETVELTGPDGETAIVNAEDVAEWKERGWKVAAEKSTKPKSRKARVANPEE